jgi:FkbM family methyltransferase
MIKKIIYDLGCHNGSNIPYYLMKADLVVVADANPKLCQIIKNNFKKEIHQKRLVVENCIISHEKSGNKIFFYIADQMDVCSTLYPETELYFRGKRIQKTDYTKIEIVTKNILDLINLYGEPFYIKIDLEHYDHIILKEIFINNIKPNYISAECHNIEVFNLMTDNKSYNYFKIVKGSALKSEKYIIKNLCGLQINYEFPPHSAGPFGEDIKGTWLPKDLFKIDFFLKGGPSWVDIHAVLSN